MNSEVVLDVTDLARAGAGVGRDSSGRVVFVPFTAPGDRVLVRITEEGRRYSQGELVQILNPSPERVKPLCPVFGTCGGCTWQHLPYDLQWKTKVKGVRHALDRIQLNYPATWDEIPAERPWEYRNRIQLRGEGLQIGYYKRGSKELVPVDRCDIARPEINSSWEETRRLGAQKDRPYKVELHALPDGSIQRVWNAPHAAGGFTQVHDDQNAKLRGWVRDQLRGGGILYDLFGGSGNLSELLIGRYPEIHCVDTGIQDSRSLQSSGSSVHFHRSSVTTWLIRAAGRQNKVQHDGAAAILDPPRMGLDKDHREIAAALEKLGVSTVVCVGCDVDSWVRDLSAWLKRGWTVEKVMVIDLFPQTPHVECVCVLRL